uniref:Uncharacterized protein n=1 Tax=Steinernema glaseri TaxID=37863 RepID=A0A1I7ZIL1_9BILA
MYPSDDVDVDDTLIRSLGNSWGSKSGPFRIRNEALPPCQFGFGYFFGWDLFLGSKNSTAEEGATVLLLRLRSKKGQTQDITVASKTSTAMSSVCSATVVSRHGTTAVTELRIAIHIYKRKELMRPRNLEHKSSHLLGF